MLSQTAIKRLKERQKKAEERFVLARSRFEDAYNYCLPFMDDPHGIFNESTQRGFELYDDTAPQAAPEMASRMLDMVWPLFSRGFRLEAAGALTEDEKQQAQKALEKPNEQLHNLIAASNAREAVELAFMDYMATTAQCRFDLGPTLEPVRAVSLSPWEQQFDRLPDGRIRGYFRKRRMTPEEAELHYGKDNISLPAEMRREDRYTKERLEILECTVREDDMWNEPEKWCEYVILCGNHNDHCLKEEESVGFGSCPIVSWGWGRRNTNWWHYGPLMTVLPSVVTLNTVTEFVLEHADMAIGGIWKMPVTNGINVDNITLQAGTIIPYRGDTRGLEAAGQPGNIQVGEVLAQGLEERIRNGLFAEDYRGRGRTPISSREVAARQARDAQRSSNPMSRLMREFLIPWIARMVYIGRKRGLIDLPNEWQNAMTIQATSPQARAYRMEDVSNTLDFVGAINTTFGPGEANMRINKEKVIKHMAWAYEQPDDYVNTAEQMNAALAQTQQMAGLMDAAGGGPTLNPAGTPAAQEMVG